jgi:hypothetical protein
MKGIVITGQYGNGKTTTINRIIPGILKEGKKVKSKVEEYVQTKPSQLELFEYSDTKTDIYSNTIELYDQMPKYYFGGVEREHGKTVDALPILQRDFVHKTKGFSLQTSPAALLDKKSGKTVHFYPSQREELVEDALRKIAVAHKTASLIRYSFMISAFKFSGSTLNIFYKSRLVGKASPIAGAYFRESLKLIGGTEIFGSQTFVQTFPISTGILSRFFIILTISPLVLSPMIITLSMMLLPPKWLA